MAYDEMELDMLGDQRTAMFVIISDTDDTFNFVVSILYTQLFNLLCDKADDEHGGRLPYHVRLLLDEFANIGQIPKFDKLIATIRSREISASIMSGIKSIGFSLEDGSIYSGMFDLVVGGEVQAEIVNHIQHYRESPLVQKAISDMKTLLEKRQASKELEERPNTRQSVREALKNRKKAQEQQSNQEQAKPKKAKKKGEMEL